MPKIRNVTIKGTSQQVISIGELAKACGRSVATMRKFEERGILPISNYRMPSKVVNNVIRKGERIYTIKLAEELKQIFSEIKQGVKVSDSQQLKINQAFARERSQ